MSFSKTLKFTHRHFRIGELQKAIQATVQRVFPSGAEVKATLFRELRDGTSQNKFASPEEVSLICDLSHENTTIAWEFGVPLFGTTFLPSYGRLRIGHSEPFCLVCWVNSDQADWLEALCEEFRNSLSLVEWKETDDQNQGPTIWESIQALEDRVEAIEKTRQSVSRTLSCFLSIRFDEPSIGYAAQTKQFLELLGVTVITGMGYEPRTIQAKVKDRLAQAKDGIIVIVTTEGMSSWQRDEIAAAQDGNMSLIVLLEEGATFGKGIFGDHEYIPFARERISESFIALLQGIKAIESANAAKGLGATVDSKR